MATSIGGTLGTPARAQAPGWTVEPSAFESTLTITAAVFDGGERLANDNDVLGAFVGDEVRGTATAQRVGNETLFFLTAYSNQAGETLSFRVYDALSDQVLDVHETLSFVPDAVIGGATGPVILNVSAGPGNKRPAWTVDPAAFGFTMSVIAELVVGGQAGGDAESLLGAFAGQQTRGTATPVFVDGRWLFFLTVYGDSPGESISFRAYDAQQDAVVAVTEEAVFTADAVIGSTSVPLALRAAYVQGTNRPSWTVDPSRFESTMNIVAALYTGGVRSERSADLVGAFAGAELRGIASPTGVGGEMLYFLTVYGQAGDGEIAFRAYDSAGDTVVELAETVMFAPNAVHGSLSQPFVLSSPPPGGTGAHDPGWSVDPSQFGMTMNVIGTLTIDGVPVRHSGARVAALVGEEIRGAATPLDVGGRSLFFLTVYANGAREEIAFRAYDAVADRQRGVGPALVFEPNAVTGSTSNPFVWQSSPGAMQPTWTPDSTTFTQRMTLIGQLLINGEVSTHPDNVVGAFAGSEVRGSASPVAVDGRTIYPMTIYADTNGETIRFEAYDAAADLVRPVEETMVFVASSTVGSETNPLVLTTAIDPPQAAPAPLSPVDGQINVPLNPTIVWDNAARADTYELEIAASQDFADAQRFTGLTTTSIELTQSLVVSTTYYWHVRATNAGGPGPWSETWHFSTVPSAVANEDSRPVLPDDFVLEQNHPNPFSGTTLLPYAIAEPAHVQITVHDLLGRTVATPVNDVQAAGRYSVRFDGADLGSGVYVYRIQAGAFTSTRAMTLVR